MIAKYSIDNMSYDLLITLPNVIFAVNPVAFSLPLFLKQINTWFCMENTGDGIEFPVRKKLGELGISLLELPPWYSSRYFVFPS